MKISEELQKEHSKAQTMRLVKYIGDDKKRFKELMDVLLKGDFLLGQRAAWVLGHCGPLQPQLVKPYTKELIMKLKEPGIHNAVKRNILSVWEDVDIPDEFSGEVYDICYTYLRSLDEPIATKAFSMTVLEKICRQYPELKEELKLTIEDMIPYGTPAIISRGKRILKTL